jgi:hypothetical protein
LRADQLAEELIGLLVVLDQVQDRGQDDRDRTAEVERPGRLGQDRERLAQIGLDKIGPALGCADQQRAGVSQPPGRGRPVPRHALVMTHRLSEGISMIAKDLVLLAVLNPS